MTPADQARLEALDWVRRIHDPDFDAWDGHVAWLEGSQGNAAAFDEALADLDNATAGLSPAPLTVPTAANDDSAPARRGWRYPIVGGAIAAGVAALLTLRPASPPDIVRLATASGRTATATLGPRATAFLAGGTVLSYARGDPRHVRLERGEATFDVAHDEAAPFVVAAGSATVRDLGTVFDVARPGDGLVVGVRRGTVAVAAGRREIVVAAGRTLRLDGGGDGAIRNTPPDAIGAWRDGHLVFDDAMLVEVAADVSSATGLRFAADPDIAQSRFSGVIVLTPDGATLARTLAGVTGRAVVRGPDGWRIAARR